LPLPPPAATYTDDLYIFEWSEIGVEFQLERFAERKEDIACELTVNLDHPLYGGRLYSGRLLLIGPGSRRDVKNALGDRYQDIEWDGLLEQACLLSRERYRRGEPAVNLAAVEYRTASKHLLPPFLLERAITILYGDGATAKSTLMLAWCIALATGQPVMGLTPTRQCRCLFLDWEDDAETGAERLDATCKGLDIDRTSLGDNIMYQRRAVRLSETVRETRRLIAENHIDFVVVDSLGMAAGDPNNHDYMIEAVRACRALGVGVGAIHHLPKDARDKTKPFGSVYASNEARSTWLIEKAQDEQRDELSVLLTHQKTNRSQNYGKRAYRIEFLNVDDSVDMIFFNEKKVADIEAFRGRLPPHQLISEVLRRNGLLEPKDIESILAAEGIALSERTIKSTLRHYKATLFVQRGNGWGALAVPDQTASNSSNLSSAPS
jgi:hypothetical protein